MTTGAVNSQEVVEKLRQAAGVGGKAIHSDVETVDYDWSVPQTFTAAEVVRLRELLRRVGRNISRRLSEQLQADVEVAGGEPEQLYRHSFRKEEKDTAEYVYPFSRSGGAECGLLVVERSQAAAMVTRMLGSSGEQAASDRELSSLETDLLGYLLGGVMDAVSDALSEWGGATLEAQGKLLEDERPVSESVTQLCRVQFKAPDDENLCVTLVLDSTVAAEVVRPESADSARSPEDIATDMREHLGNSPVEVTVRLGTMQIPMRMVADLSVGDVVVLPARIDTPLTVRAEGKPVLQGHPVASHGKCAVKITNRLSET